VHLTAQGDVENVERREAMLIMLIMADVDGVVPVTPPITMISP
jgi:hypothetical protein